VTFAWSHFLSLAVRLLKGTPQESEERTAIGRSYYAAYCATRDYAIAKGMAYSGSKPAHEQVWQFMRAGGGATSAWNKAAAKHVGDFGVSLRALRTQADYFLHHPPTNADARRAVALSQEVMTRLATLP